jgi:hypothetical protein
MLIDRDRREMASVRAIAVGPCPRQLPPHLRAIELSLAPYAILEFGKDVHVEI